MRIIVGSILAGALLLYACSSSDDKNAGNDGGVLAGEGDGGGGAGGVPDPSVLFDTLPAPTGDKLRGVWENKLNDHGIEATLRLGFGDQFIAVALRCVPTGGGATPAFANDVIGYDIDDPDTKTGQFEYGGIMIANDAGVTCGVQLPDGILDYDINGTGMQLTKDGDPSAVIFTKVGDL